MKTEDLLGTRYRRLAKLGQGGFGEVWLAEELPVLAEIPVHPPAASSASSLVPRSSFLAASGMPAVAIKVFGQRLDPEQEARIQAEIATLARLDHPHILRYRHSFRHEEQICLVMDRMAGGSADQLLKARLQEGRGPLPPAEVAAIAGPVARALAFLHEQQPRSFIHRDVKPENILLAAAGDPVQPEVVRLADFGLTRALRETIDHTSGAATLHYAPPEILDGLTVSTASDVYSLGVTLYKLLVGRLPFDGSLSGIINGHLHQLPEFPPDLPPPWPELLRACLAKLPKDRWTAGRVAQTLGYLDPPVARRRIGQLEQEAAQRQAELTQARHRIAQLEQTVGQQAQALTAARDQVDRLEQAVQQRQAELTQARQRVAQLEQTVGQQAQALTAARDQVDRLEQAVQQRQAELTQARQRVAQLEQTVGQQAQALTAARDQVDRLEQEAQAQTLALEQARIRINQLGLEVQQRQAELAQTRQRVDQLEQEVGPLRVELTTARAEIGQLERETQQQQAELTAAQAQVGQLEQAAQQRQAELTTAQAQVNQLGQEAELQQAELATVQARVSQLGQEAQQRQTELTTAQARVNQLGQEAQQRQAELKQGKDRVRTLEQEAQQRQAELTRAQGQRRRWRWITLLVFLLGSGGTVVGWVGRSAEPANELDTHAAAHVGPSTPAGGILMNEVGTSLLFPVTSTLPINAAEIRRLILED